VLSWQAVDSLQQPTGFTKSYAFFFSLLKRKKEAKKKRVRVSLVLYGNASPEGITFFDQQKSPGGAYRRLPPP